MCGATRERCRSALKACRGNVNAAAELLLHQGFDGEAAPPTAAPTAVPAALPAALSAAAAAPYANPPLPMPAPAESEAAYAALPASLGLDLSSLWSDDPALSVPATRPSADTPSLPPLTPEELSAMLSRLEP